MEEACYDRISFAGFTGLPLDSAKPDATTICRFRNKLNQKARPDAAPELNRPLAFAYCLEEESGQMRSQSSGESAERYIVSWIAKAEQSGIQMLKRFAKTIKGTFAAFRITMNIRFRPVSWKD